MCNLTDAIDDVYSAFAHWRRGPKLNFYPGWEPPASDITALLFMPLREIAPTLLTRYAYAATAYGDPENEWWPFYVPRIAENVANYRFPEPATKDASYGYTFFLLHSWNEPANSAPRWRRTLSKKEVAAMDRYAAAFWRAHVLRPYHCITAPSPAICSKDSGGLTTLCFLDLFVGAGFPARLITDALDASQGPLADHYLADTIVALTDTLDGAVSLSTWAKGTHVSKAERHFTDWLAQPRLGQRLDRAAAVAPSEPARTLLSLALDRLIATGGYQG